MAFDLSGKISVKPFPGVTLECLQTESFRFWLARPFEGPDNRLNTNKGLHNSVDPEHWLFCVAITHAHTHIYVQCVVVIKRN